jgi:uncharacterized protein YndB with AHSA1/START domain
METVEASIHIDAPAERVWDAMAIIHEGKPTAREVSSLELIREGESERCGVGAVRKARIRGLTFVEEIVTFEPPRLLEYRVLKSTVPFRHEIGRMEFTARGDGTDVHWTSRFEFPLPLVGSRLEPVMCRRMSKTFQSILQQAKAECEAC